MKWLDMLRKWLSPPVEKKADQIDQLKAHTERVLDRNDRLIESYRHADTQLRR